MGQSTGQRGDGDPVEAALASLEKATAAERWDVVAQLARELEARRLGRSAPNVIALDAKDTKRTRRC